MKPTESISATAFCYSFLKLKTNIKDPLYAKLNMLARAHTHPYIKYDS